MNRKIIHYFLFAFFSLLVMLISIIFGWKILNEKSELILEPTRELTKESIDPTDIVYLSSQSNAAGKIIYRQGSIYQSTAPYFVIDGDGYYRLFVGEYIGPPVFSNDGKQFAVGCPEEGYICVYEIKELPNIRSFPFSANYRLPIEITRIELPGKEERIDDEYYIYSLSWRKDDEVIIATWQNKNEKKHICTFSMDSVIDCWNNDLVTNTIFTIFSPVNNDVAVSGGSDSENIIYLTDQNGNHVRPLTFGSIPAWSPDGKQLAFLTNPYNLDRGLKDPPSSVDQRGLEGIAAIDIETLEKKWLLQHVDDKKNEITSIFGYSCGDLSFECSISWSPDGNYLVFTAPYMGLYNYKIFRLNIMTGELIIIEDVHRTMSGSHAYPDWSR